jgi:hypothetical protein
VEAPVTVGIDTAVGINGFIDLTDFTPRKDRTCTSMWQCMYKCPVEDVRVGDPTHPEYEVLSAVGTAANAFYCRLTSRLGEVIGGGGRRREEGGGGGRS